jgi:hypothetical protein
MRTHGVDLVVVNKFTAEEEEGPDAVEQDIIFYYPDEE